MRAIVFALAVSALKASCPAPSPEPPVVTSPDAGDAPDAGATVYEQACYRLRAAGCPEGFHKACAETLRKADSTRLVDFHVVCLAGAGSKEQVKACGPGVKCGE